ncbi:hypothetical protein Q2T76_04525 [Lactobacillus sp. YT155]|uniref:hypothetical protein n=1 Tax=Lactobacillus sp. YT155 TaxID=3060955 RepID=UPI00265DED1A|nr:hypothetical protein [Lactobacillus sp. YT155]MDO1605321.1 hypothetical protein [Lactobacillus sp. YT155]
MKNIVKIITVGVLVFILAGCQKKAENETSHADNTEQTQPLKKQLAAVARVPMDQKISLSQEVKIAAANNDVVETRGLGFEQVTYYKNFYLPFNWLELQKESKEVLYKLPRADNGDAMLNVYLLNAYDKSPLDDGKLLSGKKLAQAIKDDGNKLSNTTTTKIGAHTWHLGIEKVPDKKMMKYTFYRVEDTGNFYDSLIVVNYVEGINAYKNDSEQVKSNIAKVKAVINSFTETKKN